MSRVEVRAVGDRLLAGARDVRAAFPDVGAMGRVVIGDRPGAPIPEDPAAARCRAALGFRWDELSLVRDGSARSLAVLDDEIAHADWLLTAL